MNINDRVQDWTKYFQLRGVKKWSEIYVGVTSNLLDRLYGFHKVDKANDVHRTIKYTSESGARALEKKLLDLGCAGDTGGGTGEGDVVFTYAYVINDHTVE